MPTDWYGILFCFARYTAAMEAMANPVCPAQECAVTVLRYALLTAHRAGNPDGWAEAALKFAKSDPRLSPLVTIANAHKFPTMGEVELKLGDKPVRLVSNPFWTSVVSQMGLPSRVERESAVVIEELEGILNKDGSFKQVKTDKYMKQREVEGFLPNARDLCNERVTGPQQCWQEFILCVISRLTRGCGCRQALCFLGLTDQALPFS
jgi:hypothetical protein